MIKIEFLDGNSKEFLEGIKVIEVAKSLSSSLAKKCVGAYFDDVLVDLNRELNSDGKLQLILQDDPIAFKILNHSTAHLLAHAVKNLYPQAKFGVGPDIEEGFYYDIDLGETIISESDLNKIENEMRKLVKQNFEMLRREVSKEKALEFFADDEYKQELIQELHDEVITIYTQGDFSDLCRGGHIGFTKNIKHFKLLKVAGAYWKGDSNNKMLQRIYGTAWFSKEALDEYLEVLVMRKERDHRKLGKELKIFQIDQSIGPGLPIWLPNGFIVKKILENYAYEREVEAGYVHVTTPVIASKKLYEISGHLDHYQDNMFPFMEGDKEEYVLRPMLCPHHMMVYRSELRSYRDLPLRLAEYGGMYRYEASGGLIGLERVRSMHLTDSHIFARYDQIQNEVEEAFKLITTAIADIGLEIDYIELALRDENDKIKYHTNDELWQSSTKMLRSALDNLGAEYVEAVGEAAFYGPKIDFQVKTILGHRITLSTIQLDYLLPQRFDLEYIGEDGEKHRPVVIHRGFISTAERLISILLEQYNGALPLWLAPNQVVVIPVNEQAHQAYADEIVKKLRAAKIRANLDNRDEKLSYKIREAQVAKIPYQLVIGDQEVANETLTYRKYGETAQVTVSVEEYLEILSAEVAKMSR